VIKIILTINRKDLLLLSFITP